MTNEQAKTIFKSMEKHGTQGVTILRLSSETQIGISKLRQLIEKYSDFFTKVGNEEKYTINSFSQYKGDVETMLVELEKENQQKKKEYLVSCFIVIALLIIMIVNSMAS